MQKVVHLSKAFCYFATENKFDALLSHEKLTKFKVCTGDVKKTPKNPNIANGGGKKKKACGKSC